MKIASLKPYLTELLIHLGVADSIAAITDQCEYVSETFQPERLKPASDPTIVSSWQTVFTPPIFDLAELAGHEISLVVAELPPGSDESDLAKARHNVEQLLGPGVKLFGYRTDTVATILDSIEQLGVAVGMGSRGRMLAQKIKAQGMNWGDNFYERTKGKRVTILLSVEPLVVAGLWFPDLIRLTSAVGEQEVSGVAHKRIDWSELVAYRPDVIIVAPIGSTLAQSMATFKQLEKMPHWEDIPAVKRGEVVFIAGDKRISSPNQYLLDAQGFVFSAIAGFDSGYITERDSFRRLRWLELQRHRI